MEPSFTKEWLIEVNIKWIDLNSGILECKECGGSWCQGYGDDWWICPYYQCNIPDVWIEKEMEEVWQTKCLQKNARVLEHSGHKSHRICPVEQKEAFICLIILPN